MLVNGYVFENSVSLIPSSADIASLQTWITAAEQTGADASSVTTVTDLKGNVTPTVTNVILNITGGGRKEFEFAGTGRIDLGNNYNFAGASPSFTIMMRTGELDMDAATFSKSDANADSYRYAIYNSEPGGAGNAYYYGAGIEGIVTLQAGSTDGEDFIWMRGNGDGTFDILFNGSVVLNNQTWGSDTTTAALLLGAQVNGGGYNDQSTGSFTEFGVWNEALSDGVIANIESELS